MLPRGIESLSETHQAVIVITIVFCIGLFGLLLTGGLPGVEAGLQTNRIIEGADIYVDSYSADLYLNGTLKETYIYNVNAASKYRMLYRSWTTLPLAVWNLSRPYVEPLQITPPLGTIPYFKEQSGKVTVTATDETSKKATSEIGSLAEANEAGCYMPQRFNPGSYAVSYLFKIHPPLECDSQYCHWNLALADKHLPYRQTTIAIHDPQGQIVQLFPHTAGTATLKKVGNTWIMTGSSPKDGLLEVEMLLSPEAAKMTGGFPRQVSDVQKKILEAQKPESESNLLLALRAMVMLFPLALAIFYFTFGREKHFTVPNVLSYVPQMRKPWLVNMVFKGDAFDFDADGFYATLLDLHERGVIEIDSRASLKIRLLKDIDAAEDAYEQKVLAFLEDNSSGGVFDPAVFESMVKNLSKSYSSSELRELRSKMDELLRRGDRDAACEFVSGRSLRILGGSGLGYVYRAAFYALFFIIFFGGISILSNPVTATALILLVQISVPAFAPSALFGRWKEDYYKEKLEWDSFRNFLSDFAMIKKYAPEDLAMWKEWLIYGTALGVGDKVREAMASLNVIIPLAFAEKGMQAHFDHAYAACAPKSSGSGGMGGGGGFGGGGGSGGGGGGAR